MGGSATVHVDAGRLKQLGLRVADFYYALRRVSAGESSTDVARDLKLSYPQQMYVDEVVQGGRMGQAQARQTKMAGMPEPIYEFEGVGYGKFEMALGGAGTIKLDKPVGSGKRIRFTCEADIVTIKHNKTRRVRTDIANVDADTFRIVEVWDLPEDEVVDEDEGEDEVVE